MSDNVSITAGSGTSIATDDIGGVQYQRIKTTWGPDGTANDTDVASGKPLPVQLRSATGLIPIGEPTDAANTATDTTSVTGVSIWKQISASIQILAGAVGSSKVATKAAAADFADGAIATIGAKADAKSTATDTTAITMMQVLKQISASSQTLAGSLNPNGQAAMAASLPVALASNQSYPTGMSPRGFAVAFATLTRPANTTAYAAGDSISDNATAGSVTALVSGNISDTNDDPITLTDILVVSTDTGLNGKKLRAYVFNSDPTASSGVGGGDNAAYSQKKAGYVGMFQGWMEAGFSDGSVGRLVPTHNDGSNYPGAGGFVVVKPVSGAKTLYIQFQAVEAFTPSANSTTIIATARGFQGRAA